jgi:hypothetical protein
MRKNLLYSFSVLGLLLAGSLSAQPILDNFDSYNPGPISSQAAHWTTWSGASGTAEDGIVTDETFASFDQSMLIAEGSVQDVLLLLGNQAGGVYRVEWNYYVPANKTGYYNFQQAQAPGVGWNLETFFNTGNMAPGTAEVIANATSLGTFSFPHGEWFNLEHIVDLDANTLELFLNGVSVFSMAYPNNLGAINFYSVDANNRYFVDDVVYEAIVEVVPPANDNCDAAVAIIPGVYEFTTIAATTDGPDQPGSDCDAFSESNLNLDIWYTYTATCDGIATMSTCGTADFDTRIGVYTNDGCPIGGEALIACNDDGEDCAGFTSVLDWSVTTGTTYLIRLGGYDDTEQGSGTFTLAEDCGSSVNDIQVINLNVYPNPAEDVAYLDLSAANSDTHEVRIFDLTGKQLQNIILTGKRVHTINTASLSTGMYLMSVGANGTEKIQKLVIK